MPVIATSALDTILTVQLNVAWAGEADCEPPRFGWWRVNLSEPANGGDLTRALAPRTWRWSALAALREAGRRADVARGGDGRASDRFRSIFRVAPLLDERLDERLDALRASGRAPHEALPELLFRLTDRDEDSAFAPGRYADWLASLPEARHTETPRGRRLVSPPDDPVLLVEKLAALLAGYDDDAWPFPHAEVTP